MLWAETREPALDVHTRCAHAFLRDTCLVFIVQAYDRDDDATFLRWVEIREQLIAMDPPAHVRYLLATLHLEDPEPAP